MISNYTFGNYKINVRMQEILSLTGLFNLVKLAIVAGCDKNEPGEWGKPQQDNTSPH